MVLLSYLYVAVLVSVRFECVAILMGEMHEAKTHVVVDRKGLWSIIWGLVILCLIWVRQGLHYIMLFQLL